jgi:hypothetical protein
VSVEATSSFVSLKTKLCQFKNKAYYEGYKDTVRVLVFFRVLGFKDLQGLGF